MYVRKNPLTQLKYKLSVKRFFEKGLCYPTDLRTYVINLKVVPVRVFLVQEYIAGTVPSRLYY